MIKATVALPLWQAAPIVRLQLESLCRQVDAPPWELVVCQEAGSVNEGHLDPRKITGIAGSLQRAGCVNVRYMETKERLPLSEKWRRMAEVAQSDTFLLCAADNYSPPSRLRESAQAIGEGFDWYDHTQGLFYDTASGTFALYERPRHSATGLFMATRTEYVRQLPVADVRRSVDGWLRRGIVNILGRPLKCYAEPGLHAGLHTDGFGTISHTRRDFYATGVVCAPFRGIIEQPALADVLPGDVAAWLESLAQVEVA